MRLFPQHRAPQWFIAGLVIALFTTAAAVFYWPALFGGLVLLPLDNLWLMPPWFGPPGAVPHNFLIGDMLLENYPWKLILEQAFRQRELPLWNPYEGAGLPYLGTGQTSALYPFTALFLLLGPLAAYGWYSALHQVLAGSLTYLFLRRLGVGRFGALLGGFVFAYSFFLTVSYIWPMVLGSAVWLPLALWSVAGLAQAAESGKLGRALVLDLPLGALAIALSLLGGHLEITAYATFAVGLYALYHAVRLGVGRASPPCPLSTEGGEGGKPSPPSPPSMERGQGGEARPLLRFIVAAGLAIGLGVLLASAQLLPFLDALSTNNRQGDTTYQQVISYALPHRQVLGLLMPDFFGNPTAHAYVDLTTFATVPVQRNAQGQPIDTIFWGTKNYVEAGGYVGVVPLLLAVVGIVRSRRRQRWFFVGLAALSLLLAFGTPLYALIYYGLPFFSQLRTPFRWLYLFDFAVAALAGYGADAITRIQNPESRIQKAGTISGSIAAPLKIGKATMAARSPRSPFWILDSGFWILLTAAPAVLLALSFLARRRSVALADQILARQGELQAAFASGAMLYSYEFRNLAIFAGLLAIGGILIWLLLGPLSPRLSPTRGEGSRTPLPPGGGEAGGEGARRRLRAIAAGLLLLAVVGDLFCFGMPFASKEPASLLEQRQDVSAALPADLAGPRFASLADPAVLRANLGVLLGVPSVGSYDTIIPSRFVRLWSLIEAPVDLPYNQIGRLHRLDSLGSPILDLLGVRYILTEAPVDSPFTRLAGQVGAIRIYERPSALPRAFVVGQAQWVPDDAAAFKALGTSGFQPASVVVLEGTPVAGGGGSGTAAIGSYGLDRVTVRTTSNGSAWLVLADAYDPGWTATLDGAATPLYNADGDFRAVQLPAGSHEVVFHYSPLAFQFGAYLSFLALVILALIITLPFWRPLTGHYAGQVERVFRNTALPLVTSFLNKGIDFGFAILMLRVLGPRNVGEYTVAIVLMGYFEIFTNFGLNSLVIREVARARDQSGRYLADAVVLRLGLCLLAAPVVAGVALLGHGLLPSDPAIIAFLLLTLSLIPSNVTTTLSGLFNAWERIDVPAGVTVVTTLARVTLGTAALLLGAGIVGLAAISLLLNLGLVIAFIVLARRTLPFVLHRPVPADLAAMLNESFPLFLNNVLVTLFFKIDVLLLQALQGSETVGYYSAAYKWVDGVLIIPSTFTFAVFPALSRFAQEKGDGLRAAFDVSIRILLGVAVPLAVLIAFLSGDLILMLGGRSFLPQSSQALAILIWFLPFSYVNGITQYALIAVNRQRFITIAFVIAAAFNLSANLLLIPRYSLYAASVVTVLSELVLMVPFLLAGRTSVGWPNWLNAAGKPALAGLLMVLVALAGARIERYLGLALALAVYLAAIWILRLFAPDEVAVLRRVVLRRQSAASRPRPQVVEA